MDVKREKLKLKLKISHKVVELWKESNSQKLWSVQQAYFSAFAFMDWLISLLLTNLKVHFTCSLHYF